MDSGDDPVAELEATIPLPGAATPQTPAPGATAKPSRRRAVLAWLGLTAVLATAVVGSNVFSVRDRLFGSAIPEAAPAVASRDAFHAVRPQAPVRTTLRSNPWWQDVTTLKGTGSATAWPFTIDKSAIQWRLTARCRSGRLVVLAPGRPKPLVDTACTGAATVAETTVRRRAMRLKVSGAGAWSLDVSQQIDAPLIEPPLPAMTAPSVRKVATGRFYKVDKTGTGTLTLYRQTGGRHVLRLERFFVTPTSDLELRLSTSRAPHTTAQYVRSRSVLVRRLDVTAGSMNFTVPADIDPADYRSLVIWCAATASAYAAASLGPAS